ncbi:hypothetical protein Tco_1089346 [Tanacetum coccineum]
MSRPPVPDTYYMPEYISEYETGIQVQTQLESDVTMARRRHGNHTDMQFVFIPQTEPNTLAHVSYCGSHRSTQESLEYLKVTRARIYLNKLTPSVGPLFLNYLEFRMTGPTPEPITPNQSPSLQDQILNHVSSLETLIKQHNERSGTLITPIRLTFGEEVDTNKGKDREEGAAEVDDDLKKPYKEVLESPFSKRIIEFSSPSH